MFDYYNNILAIKSSSLYNKEMWDAIVVLQKKVNQYLDEANESMFMDSMRELKYLKHQYQIHPETYLTCYDYKNKLKSSKINRITKGGNGRVALVEWNSLDIGLRQRIIAQVGYDPAVKTKPNLFKDSIVLDEEAKSFFEDYRKANGDKLSDKQIAQYISRANVFNAITALLKERESKRSAFGKGISILWKNIAKVVAELPTDTHPHKLPKNYRRLQTPYNNYVKNSFVGLLHKGLDNDNSSKIKGEVADWLLATYCLPNKMMIPTVMHYYNQIREEKEFPSLTESAVNKWLETPEIKRIWVLARHGKEEHDRLYKHTIKRSKSNWFPNAYWAIDGSKIDWMHYEDNIQGVAAKLKIDPVVDVYSEKIIGWSFSETENHVDHFNAVKMAVNNTGAKPYLFTYDNQSGHKSSKMQELYDKIVATHGGLHYPNKAYAHNSPVEGIFKRLQQQVINLLWFSDKQSPTVRTMDNKPNLEFIKANKHKLHKKEDLVKAWEMCVKLWNEAPHPKYKDKTRSEVFNEEAPMREEVSLLDKIDTFWIYNNRKNTYKRGGIKLTIAGLEYEYEVLNDSKTIDLDFRRKNIGIKFIVKYDPNHLNDFVALYKEDANGDLVFVANAQPKREHESIPVLMKEGDKESWKQDYDIRNVEFERDKRELEKLRERTGITPDKLIEQQELLIKFGGDLPKDQRNELDSELVYARL